MKGTKYNLYYSPQSNKKIADGLYIGNYSKSSNEMIVLSGSKMCKENKTFKPNTVNKRINAELYTEDYTEEQYILTADIHFSSPSLAAAVILGKETSGGLVWRLDDGTPFNDVKDNNIITEKVEYNKNTNNNNPITTEKTILKNSNNELSQHDIISIKEILSSRHYEEFNKPMTTITYSNIKEADDLIKDITNNPEAIFIGALMDRRIKAEKAWTIPYFILRDFNTLKFSKLQYVPLQNWIEYFQENHLHIDNKGMANVLYQGIQKVIREYSGNPSNIWKNETNALTIVNRFKSFHGVGEKIGTMIVNILYRDFNLELTDLSGIDISPDLQVVKVFKRLGITKTENLSEAIQRARELNPEYPGIYDLAAWEIGRDYCFPSNPNCIQCPVNKYCMYNK